MILDSIVSHVALNGGGTIGSTLFIGSVPSVVKSATLFNVYGGITTPDFLNKMRFTTFQAIVRDPDYQSAYAQANLLFNILTLRQIDLDGHWVYACDPNNEPYSVGSDGSGVYSFSINFTITWR